MGFTPQQAQCINTLDRPLAVTAGAGSGKTFTLTQRIVHALESGAIDDIDQLLAITYTEKAAGELKTRICRELRSHSMIDQSLKAHNAWISTIHSMCSRVLREHAIELGINPAFKVLPGAIMSSMQSDAINQTLDEAKESNDPTMQAFMDEYPAEVFGRNSTALGTILLDMGKHKAKEQCGTTLLAPPEPLSRGAILNKMVNIGNDLSFQISQQKESDRQAKADKAIHNAMAPAEYAINTGNFANMSAREFLSIVDGFPLTGYAGFGSKNYKEGTKDSVELLKECMMEAVLLESSQHLDALHHLAEIAWEKFEAAKNAEGYLTNDDLLTKTFFAMDHFPSIAACYQDKFKLVMVDEFQDTNQMQVNMISKLAGEQGERLCVVGDAQQSIYRFQGADVSVYERHLESTKASEAGLVVQLPDNFRSHMDVLALVDAIFGQNEAFGPKFMHLDPKRDNSRADASYDQEDTRVIIQRVVKQKVPKGVELEKPREAQARMLAAQFKELHDAGHKLGDMVILMGTTSNAGLYSQALQDLNLPCVVVKGSVFSKAPEVACMVDLAAALTNPNDTEALYRVLSSPLFNISAEEFMTLATRVDEDGSMRRRSLWAGVQAITTEVPIHEISQTCIAGLTAFAKAVASTGVHQLSEVMLNLVNETGYLLRLKDQGAEGQAICANVLKAIRVLDNLEVTELFSGSQLAKRYAAEVDSLQEAPGALSAEGGDFVRIMTIHSSKGLEFPIVAVTEYEKDTASLPKLLFSDANGVERYELLLSNSLKDLKNVKSAFSGSSKYAPCAEYDEDQLINAILYDDSASCVHDAMVTKEHNADAAERLRLFYVALTRAKEMLILCMTSNETKDNPLGNLKPISHLVETALCLPGEGFEDLEATYDFHGTKPAVLHTEFCQVLDEPNASASEGANASTTSPSSFVTPEALRRHHVYETEYLPLHENVFSYSTIHDYSLDPEDMEYLRTPDAYTLNEDEASDSQFERHAPSDPEKSTDFGTAVHRLCQLAVLNHQDGALLNKPPNDNLLRVSRASKLSEQQETRVDQALEHWFDSDLAKAVSALPNLRAEVPFFCPLDDEETASEPNAATTEIAASEPADAETPSTTKSLFLEGEIDLLADGNPDHPTDASVCTLVDYKTGGKASETHEDLLMKHGLQAQAYAYALLKSGYQQVTAHFVRVELLDADTGQPQMISFRFGKEDLPGIVQTLRKAHAKTTKER